MSERKFCNKRDHDGFSIECGYPLPCPYHTLIIDPVKSTLIIPLSPDTRLGQIAEIFAPKK
jgi:hypothetical protein